MALQQVPDYLSQFQGIADPGQALQQSFQQGLARQVAQAQQQRALAQQAQEDAAIKAAIDDPSGANYRRVMMLSPKEAEATERAWKSLDSETKDLQLKRMGSVYSNLTAGNLEGAKAVLKSQIDADTKAGVDTTADQQVYDLIDADPKRAAAAVGTDLAFGMGHDKFDQNFGAIRKAESDALKLPGEVAKTDAEAAKLKAETAQIPANAESERQFKTAQVQRFQDQTRSEARRLDLDERTLEASSAAKLAELDAKGVALSPQTETIRNTAALASVGATMLADSSANLVNELASYDGATAGGALNLLNKGWSALSGQKSPVQQLRTRAEQLINSDLIKALPPGPASDNDMKTLRKGFPKSTDSRETLISYFEAMERTQRRAAQAEQVKADWINSVGSLGNARDATLIGGTAVKRGERFTDYRSRVLGGASNNAAAFFAGSQK